MQIEGADLDADEVFRREQGREVRRASIDSARREEVVGQRLEAHPGRALGRRLAFRKAFTSAVRKLSRDGVRETLKNYARTDKAACS